MSGKYGLKCSYDLTWLCRLLRGHYFYVPWEVVFYNQVVDAFQLEELYGYDLPGDDVSNVWDKVYELQNDTFEFQTPVKTTKELKIQDAVNDINPITKKTFDNSVTSRFYYCRIYCKLEPNNDPTVQLQVFFSLKYSRIRYITVWVWR